MTAENTRHGTPHENVKISRWGARQTFTADGKMTYVEHGAEGLCRALIGHPELSTRSRLLISYYDPGNDHVDIAAYPW